MTRRLLTVKADGSPAALASSQMVDKVKVNRGSGQAGRFTWFLLLFMVPKSRTKPVRWRQRFAVPVAMSC